MLDATISGSLDVQDDAACTGGVVIANGTTFCVVHATNIDISDVKVTGTRAVAFVADEELTVSGTLDISADGPGSGPGAGGLGAGTSTTGASYLGAGGAGFAQVGGTGGGDSAGTVPGKAGGPTTERLTTARFIGGAPGGASECSDGMFACFDSIDFQGGGGGGGALLIACRGTVRITGLIDAGGGGGEGGGDHYTTTNVAQGGGPGGGSGGYVVFQGVHVEITGNLYANGGGGGAACSSNNCKGLTGQDGLRSTSSASGGSGIAGISAAGGRGGSLSSAPDPGVNTSNTSAGAGGGGGSMGRFEVFTPTSVTPVLTPAEASPPPVASSMKLPVK